MCVKISLHVIKKHYNVERKNNGTKNKSKKGGIYNLLVLGRGRRWGVVERVIEVNAFGRLGLFFTTGAKTNDIIKKQMHTRL